MMSLNDLNFDPAVLCRSLSRSTSKEKAFEPRTNCICSTHQLPLSQRIQSLRRTLPRQQGCAFILLLGSVTDNGVCPTDLSREPTRHRSLPSCTRQQALPQRPLWSSQALDIGRCQRESRLENLCRFRSEPDSNGATTLCRLGTGSRSRRDFVRIGFNNNRSMPLFVPLGSVPESQICDQAPHADGDSKLNPVFIAVTGGCVHDVNLLDAITPEPGSFIVMDRGYLDFARLYRIQLALAFFVIRAKENLQYRRRYSRSHDRASGVRSDQTILLTGPKSSLFYPSELRRVSYHAEDTGQRFVFLTNNFLVSAQTIAALYKYRWRIELFFKWIKQHLRIKKFYGTSVNSVKIQVWTAISVYVLVAIIKKRIGIKQDLYTILQVLSLTLFEKTPILSLFDDDYFQRTN